jgi:hypothetical protein
VSTRRRIKPKNAKADDHTNTCRISVVRRMARDGANKMAALRGI